METDMNIRQKRELEYHEKFALRNSGAINRPVPLDLIESSRRRPWIGIWKAYEILLSLSLKDSEVLVPGCGFGGDAVRLAKLGARVSASDLSPEMLKIAQQRAALNGVSNVSFQAMPLEFLDYADGRFDVIFINGVLHHVDIPAALKQLQRVLKQGGTLVVNEPYTHSSLQMMRDSAIAMRLHSRMAGFIYGTGTPYITEDERKLNERELGMILGKLLPGYQLHFLAMVSGRLVPLSWAKVGRFDRTVLAGMGRRAALLAGRVVLAGSIGR